MPTLDDITSQLKPFPEKGDPSLWLKDYITAPLKLAPELEEPLRAVCSEVALGQSSSSSSEELRAVDKAIQSLSQKWADGFLEAQKRTTAAVDKWEAELKIEEVRLVELKAQMDKLASLTEAHLKENEALIKLVDKSKIKEIKDTCSKAKDNLIIECKKAELKLKNLKWRIEHARPLLIKKWEETLSVMKLPDAIEWLVAPKYVFFKYSIKSSDTYRHNYPNGNYDFVYTTTYEVSDIALGNEEDDSPWGDQSYNTSFKDLGSAAREFCSYPGTEIELKDGLNTETFEFSVRIQDHQKDGPLYWFDFGKNEDGEETMTVIRGEV